jgi:hypothetical protein
MASLIAKQPKDTKKQTTVSLSGTVLADLELYCRFIDSARDWVINEALKSVFRRDKAFLEWKERAGAESQPNSGETLPLTLAQGPSTAAGHGKAERARFPRPETHKPSPAA